MKQFILKHKSKLILAGIFFIAISIYLFNPAVNKSINNIFSMFATGDFEVVRDFIKDYGAYAIIVSTGLMVFQAVVAPLPAFLITFANASLFGWWQGAILSWSGAMLGAVICFFIARILGREVVEKLTSKVGLANVDNFFERYGGQSVLIARLLPFVSFDIVSYAAGLTPMRFIPFFIATGIGQLPATIVYSYVGGMLTGGARLLVTGLLILFAMTILIVLLKNIYTSKTSEQI